MNMKRVMLISLAIIIVGEVTAQLPKVLIMDAKRLVEVKKKWEQKSRDTHAGR